MSQIIYYILSVFLAVGIFVLGTIFGKKNNKVFCVLCKVFSLGLALFFVLRYMWADDAIYMTYNLQSLVFESRVMTFFALVLVWFTYASNLILILYGFFDIKRINRMVAILAFPISIANILFMGFSFRAVIGIGAFESFSARAIFFAIEMGIAFGYSTMIFVTKIDWKNLFKKQQKNQDIIDFNENILKKYQKNNFWGKLKTIFKKIFGFCKKYWFDVFVVLVILLSVMPSYMLQATFGYATQVYKAKDFEIPHRIILYIGFVLPFVVHYTLKNKEFKERKFY